MVQLAGIKRTNTTKTKTKHKTEHHSKHRPTKHSVIAQRKLVIKRATGTTGRRYTTMVSRYNVSLQEKEHILSPSSSLVQQGCMAEKQGRRRRRRTTTRRRRSPNLPARWCTNDQYTTRTSPEMTYWVPRQSKRQGPFDRLEDMCIHALL